ncbi:MAG TPA: helix-turn-helix domain-containing protein [Pseudonocardiaceae bacterium]|nr:helix-turn-helix domain-containing protein [Pseudonocardiaceae bacterium]
MEVKTAGGRGVLEGAFSLLEVLARMGEAGLTRLATGAGLPKATTHRLLDQLVGLGIVQRRAGRYRMGPHMFHLGTGGGADSGAARGIPVRPAGVRGRVPRGERGCSRAGHPAAKPCRQLHPR